MPAGKKSPATREAVALALGSGETVAEAAAGAGVSTRTVYNWLADDLDFQDLLAGISQELLDRSINVLVEATTRASWRLRNLVNSKDEQIALKASTAVLSHLEVLADRVKNRIYAINSRRPEVKEANEQAMATLLARAMNQANGNGNDQAPKTNTQE